MAAQEGKVDVVRLLTEAKADVNIQTEVAIYTCTHMSWTQLIEKNVHGYAYLADI